MVAYFDFFGVRFFGPGRPDGSASSPWHGQESLKASIARVMPGKFNRSGFWSRYRNRTLALSKTLPSAGGHARTSGGRFGEKSMAVSIIPSHAPADRASALSWNEPSTSSAQDFCASAPLSTTVPLAFPTTKSARLKTMIKTRIIRSPNLNSCLQCPHDATPNPRIPSSSTIARRPDCGESAQSVTVNDSCHSANPARKHSSFLTIAAGELALVAFGAAIAALVSGRPSPRQRRLELCPKGSRPDVSVRVTSGNSHRSTAGPF
jgi:hypothetical protein